MAYPILHGTAGEDGSLQGFLEMLKIPYLGSGVLGSALGIDKLIQRNILAHNKITVPLYFVIKKSEKIKPAIYQFCQKNKCLVKPNTQGSSIGVSICQIGRELKKGVRIAAKYDQTILVEKYLLGRELTVGVWGDENPKALPPIEIIPKEDFFNFQAKYSSETREIVPAQIPAKVSQKVQDLAVLVYRILRSSGICRVDMIWDDKKNQIYILEINTIPGMTENSLIPKAIKAAGFDINQFFTRLILEKIDHA